MLVSASATRVGRGCQGRAGRSVVERGRREGAAVAGGIFLSLLGASGGGVTQSVEAVTIPGSKASKACYFLSPSDGQSGLSTPVSLRMAVKGELQLKPASRIPEEDVGYLVVAVDDTDIPKAGSKVPIDEQHIHLTKGQDTYNLDLSKGKHKLTVIFVGGSGRSFGPKNAQTIAIDVL